MSNHAPNLGWKFYVDYFDDLAYDKNREKEKAYFTKSNSLENKKKGLTTSVKFENYQDTLSKVLPDTTQKFELITTYPGLLLGSGYHHEVGIKSELILGFFFDYTTGLPIVPGSSIKGVLRSAFERAPSYVASLIKKLAQSEENLPDELILKVDVEIFGPKPGETLKRELDTQDVFYDAVPIQSATGQLLAEDNITPHINREKPELSPFSEPNPLTFLKVLPGVIFQFGFELRPSKHLPILTPEVKVKLYQQILLDLGVGAKTNVGYGHFVTQAEFLKSFGTERLIQQRHPQTIQSQEKRNEFLIVTDDQEARNELLIVADAHENYEELVVILDDDGETPGEIKAGAKYKATISKIDQKKNKIWLNLTGYNDELKGSRSSEEIKKYHVGQEVTIRIKTIDAVGKITDFEIQ